MTVCIFVYLVLTIMTDDSFLSHYMTILSCTACLAVFIHNYYNTIVMITLWYYSLIRKSLQIFTAVNFFNNNYIAKSFSTCCNRACINLN